MTTVIYSADIRRIAPKARELTEKIFASYPERARHITRLAKEEDRLHSLAAGLLLYSALGAKKIKYGEHGKPYAKEGPHFNISHSGSYALLVVDDEPVGIDIEKWFEDDFATLASFSFHEEEQANLGDNPSQKVFFDIWTLKESYIKMMGAGFSMDTKSFCVEVEGQLARIKSDSRARLRLYGWKGYSVAVCSTHSDWPEEISAVSL
jgi:4'-phosphopantetheinyl transferase